MIGGAASGRRPDLFLRIHLPTLAPAGSRGQNPGTHPVLEKAKNFKSLKLLTREKTLIAHYKLHEWAPIYNVQIWTLIKFSRVGSG